MDELRSALIKHGNARQSARNKARAESEAIRALAVQAVEEGMTKSEVCKLAQITRPALDTMLKAGH